MPLIATSKPKEPEFKRVLRYTLTSMSSHAPDFEPASYALWHSFVSGHEEIGERLKPYVEQRSRMDADRAKELFIQYFTPTLDHSELLARLVKVLEDVEVSVDSTLSDSNLLVSELEQFGDLLSEDEKQKFGERVNRMLQSSHKIRYALGRSSGLLTDTDHVVEAEMTGDRAATGSSTASIARPVNSHETISSGLRCLCAQYSPETPSSVLHIEIDTLNALTKRLGMDNPDAIVRRIAQRIRDCVAGQGDVGVANQEMILVLLDDTDGAAAEELAHEIHSTVTAEPVSIDETISLSLTITAACSQIREHDVPEGVLGRLTRCIQRAAMSGGNQVQTA